MVMWDKCLLLYIWEWELLIHTVMWVVIIIGIIIFVMSIINIYMGEDCHQSIPPHHSEDRGYFSSLVIKESNNILSRLKGKLIIMAISMTDTQQAQGVIVFVDKKGSTTDATSVVLTVADTNVATATYDDPTNTVTVVAGNTGVTALTIVAKDSKGIQLPFDDVAIEITAGDAVSGTITFGAPTEQP